jgi:hypothetical protein
MFSFSESKIRKSDWETVLLRDGIKLATIPYEDADKPEQYLFDKYVAGFGMEEAVNTPVDESSLDTYSEDELDVDLVEQSDDTHFPCDKIKKHLYKMDKPQLHEYAEKNGFSIDKRWGKKLLIDQILHAWNIRKG